MYKSVFDLTEEEFAELRERYWMDELQDKYEAPEDIPEEDIIYHFQEYGFTEEDFFCNLDNNLAHILADVGIESAAEYMDDEIREAVNFDLAPCSAYEFLAEYMRRHFIKYGEPFRIN